MIPEEHEHYIREFEKIVNKVHNKFIKNKNCKNRTTIINEDDLLDLKIIFGLSTDNGIIDSKKLIDNFYNYG